MSDKVAAKKISYTDQDVTSALKYDKFRDGTYRMLLTELERGISKDNGHLMFVAGYRVLADPEDAGSMKGPRQRAWICLPFRNEDWEGHVPLKFFARSTNAWLSAHITDDIEVNDDITLQKVPAFPFRNDDGEMEYAGNVVGSDDVEKYKKEAGEITFEVASKIFEDETDACLEKLSTAGIAVYVDISYQDGSDFPSLGNFRQALKPGELLVPADQMLEEAAPAADAEEEEEEEEVKPAAKKKASAKKGKK